jgi:hypothetical protein
MDEKWSLLGARLRTANPDCYDALTAELARLIELEELRNAALAALAMSRAPECMLPAPMPARH